MNRRKLLKTVPAAALLPMVGGAADFGAEKWELALRLANLPIAQTAKVAIVTMALTFATDDRDRIEAAYLRGEPFDDVYRRVIGNGGAS